MDTSEIAESIMKRRGAAQQNHRYHPKMKLFSFLLVETSDANLRGVIENANSDLVALRIKVGSDKYGREVAIRLTGEACIAFQMSSRLLRRNQYRTGESPLPLHKAKDKVASLREGLYQEYEEVFEPYFENETRIADVDLSRLRKAARLSSAGDEKALSGVEYAFAYYHAVIGMYYGWQSLVLAGRSIYDATEQLTGTTSNELHPPVLETLTTHFKAVLTNPLLGKATKFKNLYARPSH